MRVAIVVPRADADRAPDGARSPEHADPALLAALSGAGLTLLPCVDEASARARLAAGEVDAVLLDAAAERAARADRAQLAHDLRGPLGLVRGHAELLEADRLDGQRESLRDIAAAVGRLAALVDARVEPPASP
ncbi:MAG: hypothetical protein DRQ55_03745 [Planctomycetota bacterium]|nr:MAG: hypothetical protein DRQ55_03745 [Planctomycetota bacterium]